MKTTALMGWILSFFTITGAIHKKCEILRMQALIAEHPQSEWIFEVGQPVSLRTKNGKKFTFETIATDEFKSFHQQQREKKNSCQRPVISSCVYS